MRKTGFCGHTCRYMRVPLYARVKTGFWRSPKNLALLTHFSSITHSSGISPFHPWNLICSSSLPSIGSVKPVASNDRRIPALSATSSFHASPTHSWKSGVGGQGVPLYASAVICEGKIRILETPKIQGCRYMRAAVICEWLLYRFLSF